MSDTEELVFRAVSCTVSTGFDPQEGINWYIGRFERMARTAGLDFSSYSTSFIVSKDPARMIVRCDCRPGSDVVRLEIMTDPKSWEALSCFWAILVKQKFVIGWPEGYTRPVSIEQGHEETLQVLPQETTDKQTRDEEGEREPFVKAWELMDVDETEVNKELVFLWLTTDAPQPKLNALLFPASKTNNAAAVLCSLRKKYKDKFLLPNGKDDRNLSVRRWIDYYRTQASDSERSEYDKKLKKHDISNPTHEEALRSFGCLHEVAEKC